jgi:hypothetical protein
MISLLHALVFVAAFLLFQVELIAAKALLPAFGGSFQVWTSSVMCFQGLLLLGYATAYAVDPGHGRWLRWAALAAFAGAAALFPLDLAPFSQPDYARPAALEVAWTLLRTVGPAFFCLAPLSILAQRLLAGARLAQAANPYALYATSNLGSFAGLLSFPVLVEPLLDANAQLALWLVGFAGVGLLLFAALFRLQGSSTTEQSAPANAAPPAPPSWRARMTWLTLSAAGSLLFLAATNLITFDIAAAPLLWVLPLALYLLSFTLTFKKNTWYPKAIRERFPLAAAIGLFLFLMAFQSYRLPPLALIAAHLTVVFLICVVCNGELYKSRPADARQLPAFYLYLALGGFLGGALASWIAPLLAAAVIEYPLALCLVALGLCLSSAPSRPKAWAVLIACGTLAIPLAWLSAVEAYGLALSSLFSASAGFCLALLFYILRARPIETALCLGLATLMTPALAQWQPGKQLELAHRNFYGVYRVEQAEGKRLLLHGATLHGSQYLDPAKQDQALTYYHRATPVGEVMSSEFFDFPSVAIVGLGAGSLAVYGKPGQRMDYYELDPYNEVAARRYFTFLERCKARLGLIFGDARLTLGREESPRYSLLIIDAFNSDAIPTHLLTVEAFELYRRKVGDKGLVLLHISNKYLRLAPVVQANARVLGLRALINRAPRESLPPDAEACLWAALTSDEAIARTLASRLGWTDTAVSPEPATRPWTDRSSNLLAVMQ